jgi:anaerobic magnesium-protoporphyrin IX monomethyl ester cyclase
MKVLIATPPAYLYDENRFYQLGRWDWSMEIPHSKAKTMKEIYIQYPIWLAYAASYLKKNSNADVHFLDGTALRLNEVEFQDYVTKIKPDLLVMDVPTISFPLRIKMLNSIKEALPDLKIAAMGKHISGVGMDVMKSEKVIDFAMLGEIELTLAELVEKNLEPKGILGLIYREGENVVFNGIRQVDANISTYPFPERSKDTIKLYADFVFKGTPCITMITSRGCPVGCKFCYTTVFYKSSARNRGRTPEDIVAEMMYVKKEYGAKQVYFDDDTFSINPKHVEAFCSHIIKEKVDLPWSAMGDITISKENVKLMARAGCIAMKFGVESADSAVLKQMHKGTVTAEKTLAFRKLLKDEGIWAHSTFTIGHPADTEESIRATIAFEKKLNPDSSQCAIVTPQPGTPFYMEMKEKGYIVTDDLTKYDGANTSVISTPTLTNTKIDELYKWSVNEWNAYRFSMPYIANSLPLWLKYIGIKRMSGKLADLAMYKIKGGN